MQLLAQSGEQFLPVGLLPGELFTGNDNEAVDWLNQNALRSIESQGLKTYLSSRKNKEAQWSLTLPRHPAASPDMIHLGVSYTQQRVYGYDGLYWTAPARVEDYDLSAFPEGSNEYRPTHIAITMPHYQIMQPWELFTGTLERHLPSDLVTLAPLPEPMIGKL